MNSGMSNLMGGTSTSSMPSYNYIGGGMSNLMDGTSTTSMPNYNYMNSIGGMSNLMGGMSIGSTPGYNYLDNAALIGLPYRNDFQISSPSSSSSSSSPSSSSSSSSSSSQPVGSDEVIRIINGIGIGSLPIIQSHNNVNLIEGYEKILKTQAAEETDLYLGTRLDRELDFLERSRKGNNEFRALSNDFALPSLVLNDFIRSGFTNEQRRVGVAVYLVSGAIVCGEMPPVAQQDINSILNAVKHNINYFPPNALGRRLNIILEAFSKCKPNDFDSENLCLISDAVIGRRERV
jgi:hypothetical protein